MWPLYGVDPAPYREHEIVDEGMVPREVFQSSRDAFSPADRVVQYGVLPYGWD